MKGILSLFSSRKFKLTAAAVLGIVATVLTGEITWAQAVWPIVVAVAANVFGIAIEDAGAKSKGGD
jgi:hypothetical protein